MSNKPNILFIFTDQHRLSAVGAYGKTPCKTPNIDKLAEEGVKFENAYTSCPVCTPARATIMTGQYPHKNGMCSNIDDLGCSVQGLEDRPALLSRRLESAGYSLGYTGKWHLGTVEKKLYDTTNVTSLPKDVGFEGQNFPSHGAGGFGFTEYKEYLKEEGFEHKVKPWAEKTKNIWGDSARELEGPVESTVPYFLAKHTISLIDKYKTGNKPFFIWHNFWGPHSPYYSPKEFIDMYRNVEIPQWPNFNWPSRSIPGVHHVNIHPEHEKLTWKEYEMVVRYYYAFTTLIDTQIGRVIKHLEETGLLDNTIIIFAADHGDTIGSHGGLMDKGFYHFEEIHRIPFIIRFPDKRYSGKEIEEFVSLIDVYPTILDMAGGTYDKENIHGESLVPLISGKASDWRDTVVAECMGLGGSVITQRTLRHKNYKYGYNFGTGDELYDLDLDPHEMQNLINHPGYSKILLDLRHKMRDWMIKTKDPARALFEKGKMRYYTNIGI